MSETKNNLQRQKPKLCWMAVASPVVVVVGWCVFVIAVRFEHILVLHDYGLLVFIASLVIGILLGLGSERYIHQSQGILKGRVFSISGIALVIVSLLCFIPRRCIPTQPRFSSKWGEGQAIAGTIATAIRAYAEKESADVTFPEDNDFDTLGFTTGDMDGTYFNQTTDKMFSFTIHSMNPPRFTITVVNENLEPNMITLNHDGVWTEKDE